MQAPGAGSKTRSRIALTCFALATVTGGGCDLQTKAWARQTLSDLPGKTMSVFDPWLDFALVYNRGTAFSMVRDLGDGRWFFGIMALLVVGWLVYTVARRHTHAIDALALGSIAGGAIGNGFDRVFRSAPGGGTGVIDFIKINYPWGGSYPTFNIADVLIAAGVIALVLHHVLRPKLEARSGTNAAPTPEPG